MNLWYTRLFTAPYLSLRRSRSSALRYARAVILDECQIYSWPWEMKPRWPPVPRSARSCRSYEKIGDCEQPIDISEYKIMETQFDRILTKSKTEVSHEFSTVIHSLSNTTTWLPGKDGRSHFCVNWGTFKPSCSAVMWLFVSMVLSW